MTWQKRLIPYTSAVLLAGCSTFSFAPPTVDLASRASVTGDKDVSCERQITYSGQITEDVVGARALIDNFHYVYRCRAHAAANGRQVFEVPALLALAGATTASAFGAGPNVAIAGGAANAILGGGKDYYSPKQKAEVFDHALDALLCIKSEAVGVTAFDTSNGSRMMVSAMLVTQVHVSVQQQYFDMISSALFSVERVLSQRLSNVSSFDPDGLVAEITALNDKIKQAEATPSPAPSPLPTVSPSPLPSPSPSPSGSPSPAAVVTTDPALANIIKTLGAGQGSSDSDQVALDIAVIQPRLQKCVVRAKL